MEKSTEGLRPLQMGVWQLSPVSKGCVYEQYETYNLLQRHNKYWISI